MIARAHHRVRTSPRLGRFVLGCIPDLPCYVRVAPIGKMRIRLRQNRMYWLRPPLTHEGFMLGALARFVRPGDVVYDLGANIGLYSRFLVQVFGASRVYAFEPVEDNVKLLQENLELGDCLGKVRIMRYAVGDEDGVCDFQLDDMSSNSGTIDRVTGGEASASRRQYGLPALKTRVTAARLDTLLEKAPTGLALPKPDVIKIDIEGAEAMALGGAARLLTKERPRLAIETHGAEVARQVISTLLALGYCCAGHLEANGTREYREILASDIDRITAKYSLHFIAASPDPTDVLQPIESFEIESRRVKRSESEPALRFRLL